jgi:hypothetical protein
MSTRRCCPSRSPPESAPPRARAREKLFKTFGFEQQQQQLLLRQHRRALHHVKRLDFAERELARAAQRLETLDTQERKLLERDYAGRVSERVYEREFGRISGSAPQPRKTSMTSTSATTRPHACSTAH